MDEKTAIPLIEKEWELDVGSLGKLRHRVFDRAGFDRLEALLREVHISNEESVHRRFVSLTWYIPMFMYWQIEGLELKGRDATPIRRELDTLTAILDDLLGAP